METITLNNGIKMPILGYGVYMVDPSVTERCVLDAISVGYRSLDAPEGIEHPFLPASSYRLPEPSTNIFETKDKNTSPTLHF